MILEIAALTVKPGMEAELEAGVAKAAPAFRGAKGCHGMEPQVEHVATVFHGFGGTIQS